MANLIKAVKQCRAAKKHAIKLGLIPRCWVATKRFYEKVGKKTFLGLPILNSEVEGIIVWGDRRTEVVLLSDVEMIQ